MGTRRGSPSVTCLPHSVDFTLCITPLLKDCFTPGLGHEAGSLSLVSDGHIPGAKQTSGWITSADTQEAECWVLWSWGPAQESPRKMAPSMTLLTPGSEPGPSSLAAQPGPHPHR